MTLDLLTGRVDASHPFRRWLLRAGASEAELAFFTEQPCPPAVVGLNYYLTSDRFLDDRLVKYPSCFHGGNGRIEYADVEAVRARRHGIVGHEALMMRAWERYHLPVAMTEVHLGCTREEQMRWLLESWRAARRARERGADVRAITAWALLGCYDWDSLVTCDDGRYEPGVYDVRSPEPRPTALATLVRTLANNEEPDHPVLASPGWWRRLDRQIYATPAAPVLPTSGGRPLLIVGSTGTLGRAFQRIAAERGLTAVVVGRQELDITNPTRVDAVLRRFTPWAVINAAGYVRVDAAEADGAACQVANAAGPANLAAACRRRGLPLVTFSSDLVFDGRMARPYVEDDAPSPLNVYGASKAEAERRVLALLPAALVIRTSAFFGPWDEHNFLAALFRALDAEEDFAAPDDSIVSPTYVPDLVHASLDLLIDGERGIWHLANAGAVSWWELARRAAALAGRRVDGIHAVATRELWQPAERPAYSALGSRRAALMRPLDEALTAYVTARGAAAAQDVRSRVLP
jgi:dTDP-4-dehydrorhamnose reductase